VPREMLRYGGHHQIPMRISAIKWFVGEQQIATGGLVAELLKKFEHETPTRLVILCLGEVPDKSTSVIGLYAVLSTSSA
jgi:hypothetical protein